MDNKNYQVVRVVDTRLCAENENHVKFVCEEGPQTVSYTPLDATSHSDLGSNFNLNNIGTWTNRDSRLSITMPFTAVFSVTNTSGGPLPLIVNSNFGFKCYPVGRICASINHQINQASYNFQCSEIIDALSKLNSNPIHQNYYDNTQPDMTDRYDGSVGGSNLSPLANYMANIQGDGVYKPRNLNWRIVGSNSVAAGAGTVTVEGEITEPLLSPWNNISDKARRGYYGITGEIVNLQYISDLSKMLAFYLPPNFTMASKPVVHLTSSLLAKPRLHCIYLTPYESMIKEIPHNSVYQYNDYQLFTTDIGAVAAAGNPGAKLVGIPSPLATFTSIPKKVLIYARLNNDNVTYGTPDKYLKITNISVTFDNGLPCLTSATTRQMWEVSKRNNLCMPECAFEQKLLNPNDNAAGAPPVYGAGSVLVLDPAMDLNLRPGSSNASSGRYIMQATVDFENTTNIAFPACTLFIVSINDGLLERNGTEYRNFTLSLPLDVLDSARDLEAIDHQSYLDAKHANAFNGAGISDWFRKAANLGKRALNFVGKHKDNLNTVYNVGRQIAENRSINPSQAFQLYNVGKKLTGGKKGSKSKKHMKGGADLIYSRDVRPSKNMELFYE